MLFRLLIWLRMVVALGMLLALLAATVALGEWILDEADEERGEPDMDEDSDEDWL